MKILFINLKDIEGGAAIAAYRLASGLEKYFDTQNIFIVNKKFSSDANVFPTISTPSETITEIKRFIQFLTNKFLNRFGLQYCYIPFSTSFILKKAREFKPDIISLHITHGGYFKTSLIKKLSKIAPIVWTQHDMWAVTGNAAHTFGDESWKQMRTGPNEKSTYPHIGIDTGKWLLRRKKKIVSTSNIHAVTPSNWMKDIFKQSPVFEGKPISLITHGIDLDVFKPIDKKACRTALDLPLDVPILMFSSADDLTKSAWKGGPLLVDILTQINAKTTQPIHVLVLGKGRLDSLQHLTNLILHQVGYVQSEKLIPVMLSASDLFIYPTRADSLGLALVESLACGTPCVTFKIGGCVDVIKDGIGGYIIEPFKVDEFAQCVVELLGNPQRLKALSISSRQYALDFFSLKEMATKYHELFKSLI